MDPLAIEDVAQLLAVQPGENATRAGDSGHTRIEIVALFSVQCVAVFQQYSA